MQRLSEYWDKSYSRYVEPFAGSAVLFFNLDPETALLGDINRDLIQTFRQVRLHPLEVSEALSKLRKGKQQFLKLRSLDISRLSKIDRAARFIYLNRFCFNGLYRTNKSGKFNVPYGGKRAGSLPDRDSLLICSEKLRRALLVNCSFEHTLEQVKSGDFVYMDPPFSVKATRVFREYDASVFSTEQLNLLRSWMRRLDKFGIPFLVSYADSNEGNMLGKGFHMQTVAVRRNIAGFAAHRTRVNELLISNVKPNHNGPTV